MSAWPLIIGAGSAAVCIMLFAYGLDGFLKLCEEIVADDVETGRS